MTVSEAAQEYVILNNPGAYSGPYMNDRTPYMVEPANTLGVRDKKAVIFCGSAQSAKTQALILNWNAYNVKIDPMDMIIYCPSMAAARDFSTRRVDRLHRYSPEVGAMLLRNRDADNKFDKHYTTGTILTLSWPSVVEFAGRPIGRVAITDYDRIPDDIDGEGSAYDLASKRTTTYGSYAMTLAESSPSRPIKDPEKWIRKTPHEAPPCDGILGLYNRGDRRKWYWPCPDCGSYFVGDWKLLEWDRQAGDHMEQSATVKMVCPHCEYKIDPDERYDMQQWGVWLRDGQWIEKGRVCGKGINSDIASFWLDGTAAGFQTWPQLVRLYLAAEESYDKTGSEEALTKFYNNDLGAPYIPKAMESARLPEIVKARAENWGSTKEEPTVPVNVRFLVATVDVQANLFVVEVKGVLPGMPHDSVLIDRFDIRKSERFDEDNDRAWVKPGSYLEDWDLIKDQVIKRTYPLCDATGRRMIIRMTFCDSGGKEGVTSNAYAFYRKLRAEGLAGRFHLVKGDPLPNVPRVRVHYPDSSNRDQKAAAQGDVPVLFINSNMVKDMLNNRLECITPGAGMFRYPDWLPDWYYGELCAEFRDEKGWHNPSRTRNEAWDLAYYFLGGCISPLINVEKIDWSRPPGWAAEWDANTSIIKAASLEEAFAPRKIDVRDFAKLGASLG